MKLNETASALLRKASVKRWRQNWYAWEQATGAYRQRSDEAQRADLARFLSRIGKNASIGSVSNTEENIKALSLVDDTIRPPCWLNGHRSRNGTGVFVSFKNGILNMDRPEDGLLPHSPDFWTLCSLPYNFDLEAVCPEFEQALTTWFPEEEKRMVIQKWSGYCFMPGNPEQRFLLNQGNGSDGKSQFATVLRALVGEENCQGVGLEAFDPKNRFGLEPLLGATLNIVGDANDIEKMGEGVLKAIVGGDPVTIDRKHKTAITETLACKFMMNCNSLPPFRDRTEGLWRRLILLKWEQTVDQEHRIKDYGAKLVEREIAGIFNWALCGYYRVRKEGFKFDPSGYIQNGISEARKIVQKEREFFEDCVAWDPDPKTTVCCSLPALVGAYQGWCKECNVRAALYGQNLGRELLTHLREVYPQHSKRFNPSGPGSIKQKRCVIAEDSSTKRQWTYVGVSLRGVVSDLCG